MPVDRGRQVTDGVHSPAFSRTHFGINVSTGLLLILVGAANAVYQALRHVLRVGVRVLPAIAIANGNTDRQDKEELEHGNLGIVPPLMRRESYTKRRAIKGSGNAAAALNVAGSGNGEIGGGCFPGFC